MAGGRKVSKAQSMIWPNFYLDRKKAGVEALLRPYNRNSCYIILPKSSSSTFKITVAGDLPGSVG